MKIWYYIIVKKILTITDKAEGKRNLKGKGGKYGGHERICSIQ
jgi:hypothetical protein